MLTIFELVWAINDLKFFELTLMIVAHICGAHAIYKPFIPRNAFMSIPTSHLFFFIFGETFLFTIFTFYKMGQQDDFFFFCWPCLDIRLSMMLYWEQHKLVFLDIWTGDMVSFL